MREMERKVKEHEGDGGKVREHEGDGEEGEGT